MEKDTVKRGKATCPECGSDDIYPNDSGEFETDSAYCLFHCEDCGKNFNVYYKVILN